MALITKIGTEENIRTPSAYRVKRQDLDTANSIRNESGDLFRERVRAGVYKIECEWQGIFQSELGAITAAIAPALFEMEFYDGDSDTMQTATMYVGDRDAELLKYVEGGDSLWRFKVNFIEK